MYVDNSVIIAIAVVFLGGMAYFLFRPKNKPAEAKNPGPSTLPLQLQAYERLVILAERIGLRSLIGNQPTDGLSAKEYQALLVDAIKREYEYNVSQQIYVAPKAWEAVQNLKEQNIYVINQISSFLNGEAGGRDLARAIAEYLSGPENATLQQIVIEGLNIEAKKLMH
ncbi:DUF7935 family protein [Dinghuibacter silviterrae]|uniref:Uncharacterized protein n=1 Tax=Dinghuibacter silviterrae TaxID=1539049 RepID=A0A4R8DTC2_9BACT|nr:hypothetical protein [Dinghuibacter silviterrae]TDX01146.1 hypothetical protein EDB95_2177 [Dinghuibacter silviterrae]